MMPSASGSRCSSSITSRPVPVKAITARPSAPRVGGASCTRVVGDRPERVGEDRAPSLLLRPDLREQVGVGEGIEVEGDVGLREDRAPGRRRPAAP